MDKMELKKGYKPAELNAFMQEVFRSGKRAERTPDGGWRVVSNVPKVDTSKRKVDTSQRKVDTSKIPYLGVNDFGETVNGAVSTGTVEEQPAKKGIWNRFKSFFKSK
jgi:hypothetical protein